MKDLSETDKAYIAGIIDGEGSISITRSTSTYCLVVAINNTSMELMEYLSSKLEKNIYKDRKVKEGQKQLYQLNICGLEAKELLEQIIPYLIVKKERAELAMEFPVSKKGGRRDLSDEEKSTKVAYYVRFASLNKRGV